MIQQVNLYKAEFRPQRQWLTAVNGLVAALVVLALVLATGGWFRYQAAGLEQSVAGERATNDRLRQSIEALAEDIQSRRPDPELESAITRVTDTLTRRQRLLGRVERLANNPSGGFSVPMTALARQIPDGLWLTGLNLQRDNVTLMGRTSSGNLVPVYLERLGEEPAFTGQAFSGFTLGRSDDHPWIEFRVATTRDGEGQQ